MSSFYDLIDLTVLWKLLEPSAFLHVLCFLLLMYLGTQAYNFIFPSELNRELVERDNKAAK